MIVAENQFNDMLNNASRSIKARVELLEGSTLLNTFTYDGALKELEINRCGSPNKFFGFGITQKLTVKLRDKERKINIVKGQCLEVVFGVGNEEYIYTCPVFFVEEITRDENTNDLTIVAYDALYKAQNHTVKELKLTASYKVGDVIKACAAFLGMPFRYENVSEELLELYYPSGANMEGTETIKSCLDAIAELTGSVYFMCCQWCLTFRGLRVDGEPVIHIDKSKYFTLSAKTAHTLQTLTHSTELGDNLTATTDVEGEHQVIHDNPFLNMRDDTATILDKILALVSGLTATQFETKWRANFLLELGDKISMETKDGETIVAYLIDDTIKYNGGLVGTTKWSYDNDKSVENTNPNTLGEAIKKTYAKVDKVNKEIELVASETSANAENISAIRQNTNSISASVREAENRLNNSMNDLNNNMNVLAAEVEAKMTADDMTIAIKKELSNGVNSITTTTGFTFNEEGLRVSKSGSEMESLLDEDGLRVYRDNTEMLRADNTGCYAENLHSRTYLIIGGNSRMETFEYNRTGIFWIG